MHITDIMKTTSQWDKQRC